MSWGDDGLAHHLTAHTAASSGTAWQYYLVKKSAATTFTIAAAAGEVVLGVLQNDPASGGAGDIQVSGFSKVVYGGTVTMGDKLTTDASGRAVTSTKNGDHIVGRAMVSGVVSDIGTMLITHEGAASSTAETITDPGNTVKAIPVLRSGICPITSTTSDTRTLAAPTFLGQIIGLSHDVDGGSCVITVSAAFNDTGNNTITMTDAGEAITLIAMQIAGAPRWRILSNDGCTLSTV